MSEDVNGGKRRIIVRRRSNGEGGTTGTGSNGNASSNSGTSGTSTVSGGNGNGTERNTIVTDESTGNDRIESEGMYSTTGSQSERTGSNGSSGTNGESDESGEQFLSFGIGTDSDSSRSPGPGRGAPGKPRKTRGRKASKGSVFLEQDTEDVKNIVVAVGDAASNATGFDGFKVHDVEALTIARPAARILQRHGAVAETIRTVADPLSLIIATATVFGPRIAAYKALKDMGIPMRQTAYEEPAQDNTNAVSEPVQQPTVNKDDSLSKVDLNLFNQFQV